MALRRSVGANVDMGALVCDYRGSNTEHAAAFHVFVISRAAIASVKGFCLFFITIVVCSIVTVSDNLDAQASLRIPTAFALARTFDPTAGRQAPLSSSFVGSRGNHRQYSTSLTKYKENMNSQAQQQSSHRPNDLRQRGPGAGLGSASSSWRPTSILLRARTAAMTPAAGAATSSGLSDRMRAYLRSSDDAMVGHLAVHPRAVAAMYSRQRLAAVQLAVDGAWATTTAAAAAASCRPRKNPFLNSNNGNSISNSNSNSNSSNNSDDHAVAQNAQDKRPAAAAAAAVGFAFAGGWEEEEEDDDDDDCVMRDIGEVGAQFCYDADADADDDISDIAAAAAGCGRDAVVEGMRAALAALEM
ncbi:hypothetical protein B0T26DRAFT_679513 [Lasiosphaeria miniovina]|uniref:Uncharacterized protein n=1 Tax=Lasiosphaeria miniovina TaxID=1954250 RepID=A0AA40DR54_9PEZI|nr:uncharacterized protein B0T26DRAFT_679513 [Lasiosphaeria miniovina]KAK0710212.1 hypothetical protein B0T26DRAFT_679513 [Lasiosphaeria miniovina]